VVLSTGVVAIAGLRGSKVGTAVSVIDSIGVVVCWGDIRVDWGRAVSWDWDGSRGIGWGRGRNSVLGSSNGSQSKESNKGLEKI